MELINREYVKLDKVDLFYLLADDSSKNAVVNNLLNSIIKYEEINDVYVGNFYLSTNSSYYDELNKIYNFEISRSILLNAFVYAGYTHDLEMIFKLNPFLSKRCVSISDLGNLADYVLDHSIDFNEYCDGEEQKLIFDESSNSFISGYIYTSGNSFNK